MKNVKPLALIRHYQGYVLTQEIRDKNIAIYRMDGGHHYEVVRIDVKEVDFNSPLWPKFQRLGLTHREAYPKNEEWGYKGFTYTNIQAAKDRMKRMLTE